MRRFASRILHQLSDDIVQGGIVFAPRGVGKTVAVMDAVSRLGPGTALVVPTSQEYKRITYDYPRLRDTTVLLGSASEGYLRGYKKVIIDEFMLCENCWHLFANPWLWHAMVTSIQIPITVYGEFGERVRLDPKIHEQYEEEEFVSRYTLAVGEKNE